MKEEPKIVFVDKRRIKSIEDIDNLGEIEDADLDRIPSVVAKLQSKMESDDERLKEYITAHKEKMAEMDTIRKRLENDVENRATARFGEFLKDLLPVIDDIDRAVEHAGSAGEESSLIDGVRLLRNGLMRALHGKGLEEINCQGEEFDPEIAQAVATEPVDDDEMDQKITAQLAAGYMFNGRVLRPALVRVGKKVS